MIVNPTDANMKNKRGVSRAIAETGNVNFVFICQRLQFVLGGTLDAVTATRLTCVRPKLIQ